MPAEVDILVKFPIRARKAKFFKTLKQYHMMAAHAERIHYLVTMDDDDAEMCSQEVMDELHSWDNITYEYGKSKTKIEAINADMHLVEDIEWKILVLASDDMIPQVEGWDDSIRANMEQYYPDGDGVLHYHDGYQGEKLNTLCILGRKWYNRWGHIYNPVYITWWSDNEFMEISRMFNRATFINECIIRHEHPDNGVGVHDELYRKNSISGVDRQIFAERKAHGFYIRKTLIIQPGRWGDILINLPIAKHFDEQNHLVYWLCPGKYHDVFRNIDYATPIENVGSLQFDDVIDLSFGFGGKPENWWRENKANFESFIAAKYYLAGVNMQLRWQLQWKRNEAREQALYDKVVGNKESYTLTHEDTHIGRFLYVEVDNKVPFVPVDDFNVFDWYKVIENADEIHCIDSALSNFIEVVPEFRLIDKKIYLSKREPNYYLRSIYRNNWTIL